MNEQVRFMRLILFFDLPTETAYDRKEYRRFIKFLNNEGFMMLQYSVYCKLCINNDSAKTEEKRIKNEAPSDGNIRYLIISEGQYLRITNLNDTYSLQEKITTTDRTMMIGDMNNED